MTIQYSPETRREIRSKIKALIKEGIRNPEAIAGVLNGEGFVRPNGSPLPCSCFLKTQTCQNTRSFKCFALISRKENRK